MAWLYLVVAGIFEMGWPLGFKSSKQVGYRMVGLAGAIVSMVLSGWLVWLARRQIQIGAAYAV